MAAPLFKIRNPKYVIEYGIGEKGISQTITSSFLLIPSLSEGVRRHRN